MRTQGGAGRARGRARLGAGGGRQSSVFVFFEEKKRRVGFLEGEVLEVENFSTQRFVLFRRGHRFQRVLLGPFLSSSSMDARPSMSPRRRSLKTGQRERKEPPRKRRDASLSTLPLDKRGRGRGAPLLHLNSPLFLPARRGCRTPERSGRATGLETECHWPRRESSEQKKRRETKRNQRRHSFVGTSGALSSSSSPPGQRRPF